MTVTVLDPADTGAIKCRACGQEFPRFTEVKGRTLGGRNGWGALREHVRLRHPALHAACLSGMQAFDREHSLELHDLSMQTGTGRAVRSVPD